jgi:hypothetical protein
VFDSWYPSKKLLKRIRDYGWYFVCQLKKNRRFEGRPLVRYLQQPYWQATGSLAGGLKVFVVRYRRKYYATNRLSLSAREVRTLYRKRHEVEEVIKVLKSQLSLEACQGGYTRAWQATPPPKKGHRLIMLLYAWWRMCWWNVNGWIKDAPGGSSSGASSSRADSSHCQRWSGSEPLRSS